MRFFDRGWGGDRGGEEEEVLRRIVNYKSRLSWGRGEVINRHGRAPWKFSALNAPGRAITINVISHENDGIARRAVARYHRE